KQGDHSTWPQREHEAAGLIDSTRAARPSDRRDADGQQRERVGRPLGDHKQLDATPKADWHEEALLSAQESALGAGRCAPESDSDSSAAHKHAKANPDTGAQPVALIAKTARVALGARRDGQDLLHVVVRLVRSE